MTFLKDVHNIDERNSLSLSMLCSRSLVFNCIFRCLTISSSGKYIMMETNLIISILYFIIK